MEGKSVGEIAAECGLTGPETVAFLAYAGPDVTAWLGAPPNSKEEAALSELTHKINGIAERTVAIVDRLLLQHPKRPGWEWYFSPQWPAPGETEDLPFPSCRRAVEERIKELRPDWPIRTDIAGSGGLFFRGPAKR